MSKARTFAKKLTEVSSFTPFSAAQYAPNFGGFVANAFKEGFSAQEVCEIGPKLTIKENLEFFEDKKRVFRNGGKNLHVAGVEEGRVAWVIEAENRTKEDPVVVFSHGGCYYLGLFPWCVDAWRTWYEKVGKDRLSVLFLDYTLSGYEKHPFQVDQLSRTLNTLSDTCNNILISGDSAGSHISIMALRNHSYETDGVVPLKKEAIPSAALFISPWLNISPEEEGSYATYKDVDVFTAGTLNIFGELFAPDSHKTPALNPSKDTTTDWNTVLPPQERVFVYYGAKEVMKDDQERWIEHIGAKNVYKDEGTHNAVMFRPDGPAGDAIVEWLKKTV